MNGLLEIIDADLSNPRHGEAIIALLDEYARDEMGGGCGLSEFVKDNLTAELSQRGGTWVVLAFLADRPVGLCIGFEGFSTFACKPLLNIHDIVVSKDYRSRGICKRMLGRMEAIAQGLGCCKLTLEVLEGNAIAQAAYQAFGFRAYQLDPAAGNALFWQKKLEDPA